MSIMFERLKSVGLTPCQPGSIRATRCPLVVNPDSEDLLTDNVFSRLRCIAPSIWFFPLMGVAFNRSFKAVDQRLLKLEFWKKLPAPPGPHNEGTAEVDIFIRVRHLIFLIESKFRSLLLPGGPHRDQVIRYLDAAIFNYWPESNSNREIFFLLLTDTLREPETLSKYRNAQQIYDELTKVRLHVDYGEVSEMLAKNIGWATWRDLLQILESQIAKGLPLVESMIVGDVIDYLRFKLQATNQPRHRREKRDK
jgi:hypothetical protein